MVKKLKLKLNCKKKEIWEYNIYTKSVLAQWCHRRPTKVWQKGLSKQRCWNHWRKGGAVPVQWWWRTPSHILLDQLTLSQLGVQIMPSHSTLWLLFALPDFQTLRHPCQNGRSSDVFVFAFWLLNQYSTRVVLEEPAELQQLCLCSASRKKLKYVYVSVEKSQKATPSSSVPLCMDPYHVCKGKELQWE